MLGVVKSNAYGHGLIQTAQLLEREEIDVIGVDSISEAIALRQARVRAPVLVLGYTLPERYEEARSKGIAITMSTFAALEHAAALRTGRKTLRVHIKLDTGMHRQGFQKEERPALLERLCRDDLAGKVTVEGIYTHFAEAKNPLSRSFTHAQMGEFRSWIDAFHDAGFSPIAHASATGGALIVQHAGGGMVRVGIGLYGVWPSRETERILGKEVRLAPALTWRAVVSEVKSVRRGEKIGYDLTETLQRDTRIAIIPIGYWHGFPRLLSSKGRVLIRGRSARVLGRVSMDMITVDVTDIPGVHEGDIVTLIGKDGTSEIPVREMAELSLSTPYELLTRLNPLMARVPAGRLQKEKGRANVPKS
jgi:alanine racemase